jgi:DegV family protein with EDD domain
MAVKILTDSTSYIANNVLEELDIRRISLSVKFEDEAFKEIDIDNESFYDKMGRKGIPVSSQPSVGEMKEEMIKVVENGDSLLCVFISSEMSGTYSSAHMVREMVLEEYPQAQIEIIDSRSNCMQLGYAAIVAARAAEEGKPLQEVKTAAEANIRRSRFLFIPDTLQYLKKGGRIGTAGALLGSILKIIPILTVEDGKTSVLTKVRTKKNAAAAMVEKMISDVNTYGIGEISIHHIDCISEAKELVSMIKEKLGSEIDMQICDIGPVIGLHVGPGAIGIVYYTQRDMR